MAELRPSRTLSRDGGSGRWCYLRLARFRVYADGAVGLVTMEGADRNPNCLDLIAEAYALIGAHARLRPLIFGPESVSRQRIGEGCGSLTMAISDARISMMAGPMAEVTRVEEQLVGTGAYVSSTAKLPDGSPLWGSNPRGLMIFTDDGHYSWQIFRSDRPKFASKNRMQGTPEEDAAILQGNLSYFWDVLDRLRREDGRDGRRGQHLSEFRRGDASAGCHAHIG